MSERFAGKTILITGGNSGIGLASARKIVAEGGRVIITGRDDRTLQIACAELGRRAEAVRSDVARLDEIDALMTHIENRYEKLDGVVANAAIVKFAAVEALTETDFDNLFDVNVKGVFFTVQKAMPLLGRGSSVVLVGSIAAKMARPSTTLYAATKAAVSSLARTFSAAYVASGVRFNAVIPGPIETPLWERPGVLPEGSVDARKHSIASHVPLGRFGTAEEVAAAVAFTLSSESSYLIGSELMVDGGASSIFPDLHTWK